MVQIDMEVLEELNEKIEIAQNSGGFFITISTLSDDRETIKHYQCCVNFKKADLRPSLEVLKGMVEEGVSKEDSKIRKFH